MKMTLTVTMVLVLVAGTVWYFQGRQPGDRRGSPNRSKPPVVVAVARIGRGDVRDLGRYTGGLFPDSQFVVAPRIAGRLEELTVGLGDTVTRNQLVARIADDEYRLQVEQEDAAVGVARANLAEAEANLILAQSDFDRTKSLGGKKVVSRSRLEEVQAKLQGASAKKQVAQSVLSQKQAAAKAARIKLSYTRLHASWTGGSDSRVVGQKFVDEGSLLAVGTSLVSIMDLNPIIGVINVIERDFVRIEPGQQVKVTADALPDMEFSGLVRRIAPYVDEGSRQGRVELEIANPELILKPGMFIRAEMTFDHRPNVPIIPAGSLVIRGDRSGVFVARSREGSTVAEFVPIKPGLTEGDLLEVVEPEITDPIIVLGHRLLADGAQIRIVGPQVENGRKQP